jgi:superfamily II DNA or RNA helicase
MRILLPNVLAIDEEIAGNSIRQLAERDLTLDGDLATLSRGRSQGLLFQPEAPGDEIIVVPNLRMVSTDDRRVVLVPQPSRNDPDLRSGRWLKHPLRKTTPIDYPREIQLVYDSWANAFSYLEEDRAAGVQGLRKPQIGAVHAVHAHWTTTAAPGTIVMPTGTGKTDTMIAILVSQRCAKILIVVPTDALRTQIADKFLTLGVLKDPGSSVLLPQTRFPIVATLHHIPRTATEVDELFTRAQVIVTTSSIAGQCDVAVQERMAFHCPYLFIDEAHHTEAPTWKAFKERFHEQRVLQFTATPFREDGKLLDGVIIYRYPLRKAQEEGFFKPIRFVPVLEFSPPKIDAAIAAKAIEQLRADAEKGHILMARVDSVERAKKVFELYRPYTEFNPVQLHTGIHSIRARDAARRQLLSGESRIVVCVDMLGEGFDLPELKIAAFHDIRKTLAVTLQLAGRFTRARSDLGDPTFIANIADVNVREELRKLYAHDPDWNALLPDLSEKLISDQVDFQEFLRGFSELPEEVSLKSVRPATSTVVYKTHCEQWHPEKFREGIPGINACEQVHFALNDRESTLVVVTAKRSALPWIDSADLFSWEWELYVLVWSSAQDLLFINTSSNAGDYKALAHAVCGEDALLVRGQDVFRTFAGVHRLRFQNVGLTEQLGRNIRYTGRMGANVGPGVAEVQRRRTVKSVLAGGGYEGGRKTTVGASRKGRIWSHNRENVSQLASWCKQIGGKLLDDSIDPEEILKGTLEAEAVVTRPKLMPTAIDWPEDFYRTSEITWRVCFPAAELTLAEVSIELVNASEDGPLTFVLVSETDRAEIELQLFDTPTGPNYKFVTSGASPISIRRGEGAEKKDVAEFFYNDPPIIWFRDGSSLEGNQYVELKEERAPYDSAKIETWDWTDTVLTNESQGPEKDATSIQARVIRELQDKDDYLVIVDDDGKGEAADVVAIRLVGEPEAPTAIEVEFYHCKYSSELEPGQRVKDLYEVCGQAQKSISWLASADRQTDMFRHLLHRDSLRIDQGHPTRIERGNRDQLLTLKEISRLRPIQLKIFIVQPGLSRSKATRDQLELLSVTENHLMETYQIPFGAIGSK